MAKGNKNNRSARGTVALVLVFSVLLLCLVGGLLLLQVRLSLKDSPELSVEYSEPFEDPGVQSGLYFRCLNRKIMDVPYKVSGLVDTMHPGDYELIYRAKVLFYSDEIRRIIHVVDSVPPEITLVENEEHFTIPGEPYEEDGYSAADNVDGDLTDQVIRLEENGTVRYTVTDSSGNTTSILRVIRYGDILPPVITLAGEEKLEINAGTSFTDPGFTATDNVDGDLTDRVQVEGSVDIYHAGEYIITYSVKDSFENETIVTRTVTVKAQRQPDVVQPGEKTIYLTFDDGPGPYTQELLDVLAKYNVKATFFVVDTGYSDLIAKEAAAGHSIGVHSATHEYNTIYSSESAYFNDFNTMQNKIFELTGNRTTLLRFPGGSSNTVSDFNPGIMTRLTQAVTDMGYQYFDWNVSSGDAGETTDTEQVFRNVIAGVQNYNSSIVLQHDIKGFSVAAVEKIIVWGLANGYTFLPLSPDSPKAHHGINN